MLSTRDCVLVTLAVLVAVALALLINSQWGPVPNCRIVDGREINDHRCVPYCPPNPAECG